MNKTPAREIRSIVDDSGNNQYVNRIMIGTPATGLVRVEWMAARYSQIIPVNWSQVQVNEYLNGYYPTRYQVADAQNKIVDACLKNDFEWLFLLEHDVLLPEAALMILNEYLSDPHHPIISGLYYTRAHPSEPLVFRGRGNGVYADWKIGEKVWADGVPTGCLLIHHSILRTLWNDSPEYVLGGQVLRRVFETPRNLIVDLEKGIHNAISGTSDLWWCDRILKESVIERAGWKLTDCPDPRYPFLIDTRLFCGHINPNGERYPFFWNPTYLTAAQLWAEKEKATAARHTPAADEPATLGVQVTETIYAEDRFGGT